MVEIEKLNSQILKLNINQFLELIKDWQYCEWTEANFLYDLNRKWDFSFSLKQNNELIGFCIASNKLLGVYYIHLIYLSNKNRGQNFGRLMIQQAVEIASSNGIDRIELRCPESNLQSLEFYKKMNFQIIDSIKDEISGNEKDYYLRLNF